MQVIQKEHQWLASIEAVYDLQQSQQHPDHQTIMNLILAANLFALSLSLPQVTINNTLLTYLKWTEVVRFQALVPTLAVVLSAFPSLE